MTRARIVATGLGALLLLCALTAAWVVVNPDPESSSADADRFVVSSVTVEVRGSTVTLLGTVPSVDFARTLVDSLADRPDVLVVIDHLVADETTPTPVLETFHTGLDALQERPN